MTKAVQRKQCKACPWKVSTLPANDIPNNYCATKHAALKRTIANKDTLGCVEPFLLMACHETPVGREQHATFEETVK